MADNTVPLVNEYGELEQVPPEGIADAKARGYRPETDEELEKRFNEKEYGGTGNELLAGGLGAARALSFGTSDKLLTGLGVTPPEQLRGLKETNPGSSLAGEVVGAVAPLLVGDVGGLLGGAAEGAGAAVEGVSALGGAAEHGVSHLLAGLGETGMTGIARDVAAKMAGGAVEGAFYGAGHEISESALGDTELTAERLFAGAGTGALLGGGVQGVIGLTGSGISAMKRAVEERLGSTLGDQVQRLADDFAHTSRVRAAFGQSKKAMKKVYDEEKPYFGAQVKQELKSIFEERGAAPTTLEDLSKVINQRRDEVAGEANHILSGLDEVTAEGEAKRLADHAEAVSGVEGRNAEKMAAHENEKLQSFGVKIPEPEMESLPVMGKGNRISIDDATKEIRERAMAGVEPASHRNASRLLDDYLGALKEEYGETVDFATAVKIRRGVQELGNFDQAKPKEITQMWRNASRAWNDYIDEKAAPLLKEAGLDESAYKVIRQREAGLIKMSELSNDRVAANIANRRVSLTDNMAGLGLGGSLLAGGHFIAGPVGAVVGAAANKLGRMYGPAGIASLAEKTAQMLAVARASAKIDTSLSEEVVAFIEKAKFAGERAARGGVQAGARTAEKAAHERIERGALEKIAVPAASQVFGDTRFLPKDHPHAAEIDKNEPNKTVAAFKARAAELTALASNPDLSIERASELTSGMAQHMPQTATFAAQKIMQSAQFLYDKMPKPPESVSPIVKNAWQPSHAEMARFSRYMRAANDPLSVISDMRHGRVTKEGAEFLREVCSKYHGSAAGKMISALSESPATLDHQSRVQLSRFLGYPVEGSLRPDRVRMLQQQWAARPGQGQGGGGVRVTGISQMRMDDAVKTKSQRLTEGV